MPPETILERIVRWKWGEIVDHKRERPIELLQAEIAVAPPARDLCSALRAPGVSLIAEVKRASPSKGLLRHDFDAVGLARQYEANGAAAISVLTDNHFFQGDLGTLQAVRANSGLSLLRKDFLLDAYQVYESRAAGADAVLLIVAVLGDGDLRALHTLCEELGMAALIEVHNEAELERAMQVGPRMIGVNNRDLRTFEVDLETTARLRPLVPPGVLLVAESGVHTRADVERLAAIGANAMLVGEALVRAEDVGRKVRELVG